LIGNSTSSEEFLCVNKTVVLKKYSFFKSVNLAEQKETRGSVSFEIQDRPNRINLWAEKVFNLDPSNGSFELTSNSIRMAFIDVKTSSPLSISGQISA